jgi:antagonist of KipI
MPGAAGPPRQVPLVDVRSAGLLTTIQDAGRPDAAALGVPRSGACDPLAMAAANLLLGNAPEAAVLEASLLGPELRVLRSGFVALTGADMEARDSDGGRRLGLGRTHHLEEGTTLVLGAAADGARAYLAVPGGFAVPIVLGSASTCLAGRFGGFSGRPLAPGDVLLANVDEAGRPTPSERVWPGPGPSSGVPAGVDDVVLRVVPGPHAGQLTADEFGRLLSTTWEVDHRSDRMGVRLATSAAPNRDRSAAAELVSLPMTWGAVQLPPGGAPIVLLADHPTVGGYPVPLVVAAVDRPVLGQLRPPHRVRFVPVDVAEAQAAWLEAERALDEAARRLRVSGVDG